MATTEDGNGDGKGERGEHRGGRVAGIVRGFCSPVILEVHGNSTDLRSDRPMIFSSDSCNQSTVAHFKECKGLTEVLESNGMAVTAKKCTSQVETSMHTFMLENSNDDGHQKNTPPKSKKSPPSPSQSFNRRSLDKHIKRDDQRVDNTRKLQASPSSSRKPLESDNEKCSDDHETCSSTSSNAASSRTPRTKTTVPSSPVFRCGERAAKRKEFYSKLEEKNRALEAQRIQEEARCREEQEAAIRQLRKTMVYKASEVPSFYYEPPPPKVELKKPPPTRAISPKFSQRRSCMDASAHAEPGDHEAVCCNRLDRAGLCNCGHKEESSKLRSTPKIRKPACKEKEVNKSQSTGKPTTPIKTIADRTDNITVQ